MTNPAPQHIIIVAGEASGDMHAAFLIRELIKLSPDLTFSGLGGPQMKAAGVDLYADLTKIAVVGFIEILKHYGEFKKYFNLILQKIDASQARAVILVDYPGFNLRLAKELKKRRVQVIYYISPQVWAWKESRVHAIQRDTDLMLVLFDFEKDFYRQRGVDVTFVGHPFVDTVRADTPREVILKTSGLSGQKPTIGLLPGSRAKEIERMLPVMLGAAQRLHDRFPDLQFLLIRAPSVPSPLIQRYLQNSPITVQTVDQDVYSAIHACNLCLTTSGTATLETAILNKPMVVIYRVSFLTWLMARWLIRIPFIGLVNIVAGKKVVPELIQFQTTPEKIAETAESILTDETRLATMKSELRQVKDHLGQPGASRRAAEAILARL